MSFILTQVTIDDSSDKTMTGTIVFDRTNGGVLVIGAGSSFPGSPVAGELFWRTDLIALYRRNTANTAWESQSFTVNNFPLLQFGVSGLANNTTTRYMVPGFFDGNAPTTRISLPVTRAGTLRNLYVRHNTVGAGAQIITYTVLVNGSATSIAASMAPTGTQASNVVNSASVVAGDVVDIQVTKSATLGSSPNNVIASLELD